MAFWNSPAEKIYSAFATRSVKTKISAAAIADGRFHHFLKGDGFKPLIDGLLKLYQDNGETLTGQSKTLEQLWKLLSKMMRRHGLIVTHELVKVIKKAPKLLWLLENLAGDYTPRRETSTKAQAKMSAGREVWDELTTLHFPNAKKTITILKMLGKGGMGGAVYLGQDEEGERFAVKHFPGDYKSERYRTIESVIEDLNDKISAGRGDVAAHRKALTRWESVLAKVKKNPIYKSVHGGTLTPTEAKVRVDKWLNRFGEASKTSTCLDFIQRGSDQYLLLALGEGSVDWSDVTMADIIAVFQDLDTVEHYNRHHMEVDIVQDVGILHLDIHGENLMRFNGRLRLIDFGQALLYAPDTVKALGKVEEPDYQEMRFKRNLYQVGSVEGAKYFTDPSGGTAAKYIEDWRGYTATPTVKVCQSCNRQYPDLQSFTECMACGAKPLAKAKLRRADMESLAKLKKVKVETLLTGPFKSAQVPDLSPAQYGCMVLTIVLIKEMWAKEESKGQLNTGFGANATQVVNVEVYSTARRLLPKLKAAHASCAMMVELLLFWYDEMMRRLFAGEPFAAADAVRYFQPTKKEVRRGRAMSI